MSGDNPRKIIFVHQAKAAGTTVVEAFKATYGAKAVYHDQDNQHLWEMAGWRRSIELRIQPYRRYKERESYRVIHGHFRSGKYRRAFPDAFYLTMYRHPVQQLASHYHFWLRVGNPSDTNPLRRWVYEAKPGLVEFAGRWLENGDLQDRANLDVSGFDFVGITERLRDSMELLKARLPELRVDVGAHRVNPEKGVGENYVLTREDEEILRDMLRPSILLYNRAVERFDADWDTMKSKDEL